MIRFILIIPAILLLTITGIPQVIKYEKIQKPVRDLPFQSVTNSSTDAADVDQDGDQDVLITGIDSTGTNINMLYYNNGDGTYQKAHDTLFTGVGDGSAAFADVDNDNDQDLLITGTDNQNNPVAKLYKNDGNGNFTVADDSTFTGVTNSAVAFSDIDNDGDQDVLTAGETASGDSKTILYKNDGNGNYSKVNGTPFPGVILGSVAFADVNNNNYPDVLVAGQAPSGDTAVLYKNNGSGGFGQADDTTFAPVRYSAAAFADIDNDNDKDLALSGIGVSSGSRTSTLYINDGNGNFSQKASTAFPDMFGGTVNFFDINGDNYPDAFITGFFPTGTGAALYTNDGSGNYNLVDDTTFTGVDFSSVTIADTDNDTHKDILVTGQTSADIPSAELYRNNGSGNFTRINGKRPFPGVHNSSVAFADINQDGHDDVLITGNDTSGQALTRLYINQGDGTFYTESHPFPDVLSGSVTFGDITNNNYPDVLITGDTPSGDTAVLYKNDGNGGFGQADDTTFAEVILSDAAFADTDNDGNQDILLAGRTGSGQFVTHLYSNQGNGNFNQVTGTPFPGVMVGSVAFADTDGNNYPDVLVTGQTSSGDTAVLYRNDGNGNFGQPNDTAFAGGQYSSVSIADMEQDGDPDILISGLSTSAGISTLLYENNGNGRFSRVSGTSFPGVFYGSVAFKDVNNNNHPDVLITGETGEAALFRNNGSGNFNEVTSLPFQEVGRSSIALTDLNNDDDQDVLITGQTNSGGKIAQLYRNIASECNKTVSDEVTACGSYTWPVNGETYFSSDNYTVTYTTDRGCDSIRTLDLTIKHTNTSVSHSGNQLSADASGAEYQWLYCNSGNTPVSGANNKTFTPSASGSYRVKVTKNGCTDTSGCYDVIIKSATACDQYTWKTNGQTYSESGEYTEAYTNAAGYDSIHHLDLTINTVDTSVASNGIHLTAQASGASYQWINCSDGYAQVPEATNRSFEPVESGHYAVEVTNNGCTDTSSCYEVNVTGISLKKEGADVSAYPNPTEGKVYIKAPGQDQLQVTVKDATGRTVSRKTFRSSEEAVLYLKGEPGVYMVEVIAGGEAEVYKVVKE